MWRRIPLVPMLFGIFAAWALLSMLASRERSLSEARVYVVTGSFAAIYALLVYLLLPIVPRPKSRAGSIGMGCASAAVGLFFVAVVAIVAALITGRGVAIYGIAASLMAIAAFCGLGVLGGITWDRFRRAEEERRKAALEAQAAAFAREQLELARHLQQRLLPPPKLEADRYRVTARNVPAAYVAGDFYDFVPLGDGRLLVVLADVAGKGVGAGLIMATVKAMIPLVAVEQPNPAPLLGRLNDRLAGQLPAREFIAMALALYDAERGTVTLANAGLPDPLLVSQSQPVVVAGPRYPIGIRKNMSYESVTLKLTPGERLILFTDGLPEAPVRGEPLGYERLGAEMQCAGGDIERLFAALDALGAAHDDDWTAVLLEAR